MLLLRAELRELGLDVDDLGLLWRLLPLFNRSLFKLLLRPVQFRHAPRRRRLIIIFHQHRFVILEGLEESLLLLDFLVDCLLLLWQLLNLPSLFGQLIPRISCLPAFEECPDTCTHAAGDSRSCHRGHWCCFVSFWRYTESTTARIAELCRNLVPQVIAQNILTTWILLGANSTLPSCSKSMKPISSLNFSSSATLP